MVTRVAAVSQEIHASGISACPVSSVPAAANYTGTIHNKGTQTRLRISNGGGTPSIMSIIYFNALPCTLSKPVSQA